MAGRCRSGVRSNRDREIRDLARMLGMTAGQLQLQLLLIILYCLVSPSCGACDSGSMSEISEIFKSYGVFIDRFAIFPCAVCGSWPSERVLEAAPPWTKHPGHILLVLLLLYCLTMYYASCHWLFDSLSHSLQSAY